jgi:hypothetical protein
MNFFFDSYLWPSELRFSHFSPSRWAEKQLFQPKIGLVKPQTSLFWPTSGMRSGAVDWAASVGSYKNSPIMPT